MVYGTAEILANQTELEVQRHFFKWHLGVLARTNSVYRSIPFWGTESRPPSVLVLRTATDSSDSGLFLV